MASSDRENLNQLPNFAISGTVPEYLRRPSWLPRNVPMFPSPPPGAWPLPSLKEPSPDSSPFLELVPPFQTPHDVDPPKDNPDNDPNYNPNSLVTEDSSDPTKVPAVSWACYKASYQVSLKPMSVRISPYRKRRNKGSMFRQICRKWCEYWSEGEAVNDRQSPTNLLSAIAMTVLDAPNVGGMSVRNGARSLEGLALFTELRS